MRCNKAVKHFVLSDLVNNKRIESLFFSVEEQKQLRIGRQQKETTLFFSERFFCSGFNYRRRCPRQRYNEFSQANERGSDEVRYFFLFFFERKKNIYKRIERLFLQVDKQRKQTEQTDESNRRKQPKGKNIFTRE